MLVTFPGTSELSMLTLGCYWLQLLTCVIAKEELIESLLSLTKKSMMKNEWWEYLLKAFFVTLNI